MKRMILISIAGVPCVIWALIINQFSKDDGLNKKTVAEFSIPNGKFRDSATNNEWIIIYFSPGCDACEHEATYFIRNQRLIPAHNVYFISDAPMKELRQFALEQGIDKVPRFKVFHDQNNEIRKRFHIKSYPTILFFNRERNFLHKIEGETSFSKIFPLLTP